jgi:type VI protein secretion system component VasF
MEQVAASSEQQSASTQEIAGAANTLAAAAERLTRLVAGLRLGTAAPVPSPTAEQSATAIGTARPTVAMRAVPVTA